MMGAGGPMATVLPTSLHSVLLCLEKKNRKKQMNNPLKVSSAHEDIEIFWDCRKVDSTVTSLVCTVCTISTTSLHKCNVASFYAVFESTRGHMTGLLC